MATQANPWDNDPIITPAAPPRASGPVYGAPADPFKVNAEQRAVADQAMQTQKFQLDQKKFAKEQQRQAQQDALGTESERTAGFLAGRISDAVKRLAPAAQKNPAAQGPTTGVEMVRGVAGDNAANFFTNAERQQIYAAQRDILDAALTLGTGAAYTKEQLKGYETSYLPQLYDDPTTIQSKRQALRTLLQEATKKAGRSAPDIQAAISALDGLPAIPTGDQPEPEGLSGTVTDDSPPRPGEINSTPPDGGGGVSPEMARIAQDAQTMAFGDPASLHGLSSLAQQGITLGLSDEASGAGGFLSNLVQGKNPTEGYIASRDAARQYDDRARRAWGLTGSAVEMLGGGAGAKLAAAPSTLLGAFKTGAGLGGAAGFGYGDGAADSTAGAVTGGVLGGVLGGAGYGVGSLASRYMGRNAPDLAVVQAGERQGIPIRQPDARPDLRGKYAAMESTEKAGPQITAARASDAQAIADRASEVAGGTPFDRADNTALGQSVQGIAERGQQAVKDSASGLYTRVERLAPGFKTPASNTAAFIDSKIAELQARSPTGYDAEVRALEGMKSDLAQTGLSVESLQAQRETIGGRIGDNMLDRSRADRTFTEVLKVAQEELHSSLKAASPQAAEMLKRADAKYGQYKRVQKEVSALFLGKRGDATSESAARALNATTRNNYTALRKFVTMASPEERADFAATFVQNWGTNQRGEFSPAIFAKSMEKVSDRTLNTVLGTDGRMALRDLQAIANAKTDAMSRISPSGKAIGNAASGLKTTLMAALGYSTGGVSGAVTGAVAKSLIASWGEQRAARMLLNPNFTKWLRRAPNTSNPQEISNYVSQLGTVGGLAANDNETFTRALMQAFQQSPGRAAAQDEPNGRRKPPQ
jgi:hypothetical protein